MASPSNDSDAVLAAEALQRRRATNARSSTGTLIRIEERLNPQMDRFELHLEAIREQLDRCLKGIAENKNSLKALRQDSLVGVTRTKSNAIDMSSLLSQRYAPQGIQSSFELHHPLEHGEGDRMRELMKARRIGDGIPENESAARSSIHSTFKTKITFTPTKGKQRRRSKFAVQLWKLLDEPESSRAATWANRSSSLIICVGLILTLLDSGHAPASSFESVIFQLFCDSFVALELMARFYACPRRDVFLREVYTFFEIVASFPILIVRAKSFIDGPLAADTWSYVILVAFAPVLRLLMVLRRFEQIHLLVSAFRSAAEALPVMLYTLLILIAGFAAVLFAVEPRANIDSFAEALWLTIVTCYTVGYGDVLPESDLGHFVASLLMVCGALYMAIPIGIVGDAFSRVWAKREALLLIRRMSSRLRFAHITAHDIPSLFHSFDWDEDGLISPQEFLEIIQFMCVNLDDSQASQLFNLIDSDGNGHITDEEFVQAIFPADFDKIYITPNSLVNIRELSLKSDTHTTQHPIAPASESVERVSRSRSASSCEETPAQHMDSTAARIRSLEELNSTSSTGDDPYSGSFGLPLQGSEDYETLEASRLRPRIDTSSTLRGANQGFRDI